MFLKHLLSLSIMITIFLMLSSCDEDNTSPGEESPFKGSWHFTIDGDAYGGGTCYVNSNGQASFDLTFTKSGVDYPQVISGSISNSGSVTATVKYNNSKIGTITGTLSGNTGNGVWNTSLAGSGTWIAEREID